MPKHTGRPFPTHTKIGQALDRRGLTVFEACIGSGVHTRTMSTVLSGRQRPTARTLGQLSEYLRLPAESLIEDSYPCLAESAQAAS